MSNHNIKLLDCTLRDGGYLNDWEFGHDVICNIFERLVGAGVDVIEVGFLNDSRTFDINRTIMPNTDAITQIYGKLDRGKSMIVGMIDYGTCSIEYIKPCNKSYIDGIRVIFKEHLMHDALEFCRKLKELGYIVFAQLVSVTTYTDEKLVELTEIVNEIKPYALSMVDTYGLTHTEDIVHIFRVLDQHLDSEITIGYHAHNNFQLGYANSIVILKEETKRDVLVDGTLYGMGKSAGNAPLELLAMYMNEKCGKNYDVDQILEAIETSIIEIQKNVQWGYNLFYYEAASTKCHPNYVSYFMNKRTLSMKSINEILNLIKGEKRLFFDKKYAEEIYLDYQKSECNDEAALAKLYHEFAGAKVVIFGPGESMETEKNEISHFMEHSSNLIVMAINYIPKEYKPDYVFLTNSKRYIQLSSAQQEEENKDVKFIATSNITKTSGRFHYELNYEKLIDIHAEIQDNSLIMLLKLLRQLEVKEINLIGFDGYIEDKMNYFQSNMQYDFVPNKAEYLNQYVNDYLRETRDKGVIRFVTSTQYQGISCT